MTDTRPRPEFKRPYCDTCKNIPRIRGRWTQLHCRDCRYPGKNFHSYLIVRLMHHYDELESRMMQLHKQHTILLRMYTEAVKVGASLLHNPSPDTEDTHDEPQADS